MCCRQDRSRVPVAPFQDDLLLRFPDRARAEADQRPALAVGAEHFFRRWKRHIGQALQFIVCIYESLWWPQKQSTQSEELGRKVLGLVDEYRVIGGSRRFCEIESLLARALELSIHAKFRSC